MSKMGVAIIGCGFISEAYFNTFKMFDFVEVRACTDLMPELATQQALKYGTRASNQKEILASEDIDIVVNLTPPLAHYDINLAAMRAGKHVYSEKPMAVDLKEARHLIREADRCGVTFCSATDTFLGGGHQETRQLLDSGIIGAPVAATAHMLSPGHERWHPSPSFFYQRGAGPLLDLGPYYVTNLIHLFGPVRRVSGMSKTTRKERLIENGPRRGETISVDVPTHIIGLLEFYDGTLVNIATSFDVQRHKHQKLEIYGLEGSIVPPDPNIFGGINEVIIKGEEEWTEHEPSFTYTEGNLRGLGATDLAYSLQNGLCPRTNGDLPLHALEVMCAIEEAARTSSYIDIETKCERPRPVVPGLSLGEWG